MIYFLWNFKEVQCWKREKRKEKKFNFSSLLENIISQVKIVDIIDLTYRFDTLTITQSFALRKKKGEKMTSTGNKSLSDSFLPLQPFCIETIFKYKLKKKKKKKKEGNKWRVTSERNFVRDENKKNPKEFT